MTPRSVRECADAPRPRYLAAGKVEKGRILTEFCRVTGITGIRRSGCYGIPVGYDRYTTRAVYEQLEKLYDSLRLYINFFQPIRKLIAKERVGSKVIKMYDAAKTPYQRLLESGVLEDEQKERLRRTYERLNPVKLKAEIDATLERLWKLAVPTKVPLSPIDRPGADMLPRDAFGSLANPSASSRTGQG